MFQPIDLIMVDKNNAIIAFFPNLKPWRIVSCKKAKACYEFSCGILKHIEIGFLISLQ